jgi:hypothetical protein
MGTAYPLNVKNRAFSCGTSEKDTWIEADFEPMEWMDHFEFETKRISE